MAAQRIAIVGAGGFAREVAWLVRDINTLRPTFDFRGFLVSDLGRVGDRDSRDLVLGDFDWLESHPNAVDGLVFGIGNPAVKLKLGDELTQRFPNLDWPTLVHPTAQFDRSSWHFGHGIVLCAGNIGTVNVHVADFAMLNLACTIGHESRIGRGAVLNPTVNISGGVEIADGVLVGTGAQILQYIKIGSGATIGAGAVVTKHVDAGDTVAGVPARSIRK